MTDKPITDIRGIGPKRAEALAKAGLFSVLDLAYFSPRSYIDYTRERLISDVPHGELAAVRTTVISPAKLVRIRRDFTMTLARARSGDEEFELVWYNQPFRARSISVGMETLACGRVDKSRGIRLIGSSFYKELPGILPVYPAVAGLSQSILREAALKALIQSKDAIAETLPLGILEKYALMPLYEALLTLHSPAGFDSLSLARRRLAFEDMLSFTLMLDILKRERLARPGVAFRTEGMLNSFLKTLPFSPTAAQLRAMREIEADMAKPAQMNRLVQGDVGSGKTAVAFYAMFVALANGKSAALMAPTEILARQHYEKLTRLFGERAVLLTGGMKKRERDAALAKLASGAYAVVGTHALLTGDVAMHDLGLVIADEQHRFGVKQRARISAKASAGELAPDSLIMSATPIPRTLSLIMYGDLDVSVIDELPPGRKPVTTRIVPPNKRRDMYAFIEREVSKGRQAYVVCPLVESSEALEGVVNVSDLYAELTKSLHARIALLHGRLSEKEAVAESFRKGEVDLLVSTTVVEVGVDVPNATGMVIEGADRFGLAQLHQLRGRVGRGEAESYCFLLTDNLSDDCRERLDTLVKTSDGFKIAEKDLSLRGPGEFLGTRQHGQDAMASAVRFASDMAALSLAREAAAEILTATDAESLALIERARSQLEERGRDIAAN